MNVEQCGCLGESVTVERSISVESVHVEECEGMGETVNVQQSWCVGAS